MQHPRDRKKSAAMAWRAFLAGLALSTVPLASSAWAAGLTARDGSEIGAETLERGTVVVVFYASWSPKCRDLVPKVEEIHEKWGTSARVLLVSFQETAAEVESFLGGRETALEIAIDEDGSFSKRHGITYLPGLLVLRGGKTLYSGKLPARDVDRSLRQILG